MNFEWAKDGDGWSYNEKNDNSNENTKNDKEERRQSSEKNGQSEKSKDGSPSRESNQSMEQMDNEIDNATKNDSNNNGNSSNKNNNNDDGDSGIGGNGIEMGIEMGMGMGMEMKEERMENIESILFASMEKDQALQSKIFSWLQNKNAQRASKAGVETRKHFNFEGLDGPKREEIADEFWEMFYEGFELNYESICSTEFDISKLYDQSQLFSSQEQLSTPLLARQASFNEFKRYLLEAKAIQCETGTSSCSAGIIGLYCGSGGGKSRMLHEMLVNKECERSITGGYQYTTNNKKNFIGLAVSYGKEQRKCGLDKIDVVAAFGWRLLINFIHKELYKCGSGEQYDFTSKLEHTIKVFDNETIKAMGITTAMRLIRLHKGIRKLTKKNKQIPVMCVVDEIMELEGDIDYTGLDAEHECETSKIAKSKSPRASNNRKSNKEKSKKSDGGGGTNKDSGRGRRRHRIHSNKENSEKMRLHGDSNNKGVKRTFNQFNEFESNENYGSDVLFIDDMIDDEKVDNIYLGDDIGKYLSGGYLLLHCVGRFLDNWNAKNGYSMFAFSSLHKCAFRVVTVSGRPLNDIAMPSLDFNSMHGSIIGSEFGEHLTRHEKSSKESNEVKMKINKNKNNKNLEDNKKKDEQGISKLGEDIQLVIEWTNGFASQFSKLYKFLNKNPKQTFDSFVVSSSKLLQECKAELLQDAKRRIDTFVSWMSDRHQELPPLYEFIGCKDVRSNTVFCLSNGSKVALSEFYKYGMIKARDADYNISFPAMFLCAITNRDWFEETIKKRNKKLMENQEIENSNKNSRDKDNSNDNSSDNGSDNDNDNDNSNSNSNSMPDKKRRKVNGGESVAGDNGGGAEYDTLAWDWMGNLFMIPNIVNELNGKKFEERMVARCGIKSREYKQVMQTIDGISYRGLQTSLRDYLGMKSKVFPSALDKICDKEWFFPQIKYINNDNDEFIKKEFDNDALIYPEKSNYPVIDFYFKAYCLGTNKWYLLAFQAKSSIKLVDQEYTEADVTKFSNEFQAYEGKKHLIIILASVRADSAKEFWNKIFKSNVICMDKSALKSFFGCQYFGLLNWSANVSGGNDKPRMERFLSAKLK